MRATSSVISLPSVAERDGCEIEALIAAGTIVILDEFQYFIRAPLAEFTSYLQASVDRIANQPNRETGGLIVLGSIQLLHPKRNAIRNGWQSITRYDRKIYRQEN